MTPAAGREPPRFTDIRLERAAGVARITLVRPEVRNAFRRETVAELLRALDEVRRDPEVGVVVLTGDGDRAFSSGADLRARPGEGIDELDAVELQRRLRALPQPTLARVNGDAVGAGMTLQLLCDLAIAADHARFAQTGPRVGSFDGGYGAAVLARAVGARRARELWLTGRRIGAPEALAIGLVNAVVPFAELDAEVDRLCDELLAASPVALRCLKAAFNADSDGLAGLAGLAAAATTLLEEHPEGREGRAAFVERRPPRFGGERGR